MKSLHHYVTTGLVALFALLCLSVTAHSVHADPARPDEPTIVGGTVATPGAWPWQARIEINGPPNCPCQGAGILIDPHWLLTAGHVVGGLDSTVALNTLTVHLGDHDTTVVEPDEQIRTVDLIIVHLDYHVINGSYSDNDIALLHLSTPANITARVQTIGFDLNGSLTIPGAQATVIGWGGTSADDQPGFISTLLRQAEVNIVSNATCNDTFAVGDNPITDNMVCAGRADGTASHCGGDSGGPLMVRDTNNNWSVVGVVNWRVNLRGHGCGVTPNVPYGVYARVSRYAHWINLHLGRLVFLPYIDNLSSPDLVVEDVQVTPTTANIVIRNIGTKPTAHTFWVDLYVSPDPVPTGVNDIWEDGRSDHGLVWGVTVSLAPGEALTLSMGDQFYHADLSEWPGTLGADKAIWIQVDSANKEEPTYGGVFETHEGMADGTYNNIAGPYYQTQAPMDNAPLVIAASTLVESVEPLPSRP